MKTLKHVIIIIALAVCYTQNSDGAESPRATKREMKGMELYSWRDAATGQWKFSLVDGTNAQKSSAEITAPKNVIKTIEELKLRLGALAVGEQVIWSLNNDPKTFSRPPKKLVQQITAFSASKKIKLSVEEE